jgi:hypothetical protein
MNRVYLFVFMPIALSGCISMLPQRSPLKETIYRGSLQSVWLATEKALVNYPIAESNIDAGLLKTDFQRGPNCFKSPGQTDKYSSGVRCQLIFNFVKIPGSGIRVRVTKVLEMVRDFVSEPESIKSDGLEEMTILYRIDRELSLAKEIRTEPTIEFESE